MIESWLRRLERRTEYTELRQIHEQIVKDARAPVDRAALVAAIEQAIGLIGRESVRDRGDLDAFEQAYDDFRDKERGMVGWLRRHLPFTETRRKDKEQRGEIEEQQAELRANLFFVARLRLLKDGLQDESTRLLGASSETWAERVQKHQAQGALRDVARVAWKLDAAVTAGEAFLADLDTDFDAFSEADFRARQDQAHQDSDLKAARKELGLALVELEGKRALFQRSRERLRTSLEAALQDQDADYRDALARIEHISQAERASEPLRENFESLHEALESLQRQTREEAELNTNPGEAAYAIFQLEERLRGAKSVVDAAERDVARTADDAREEEQDLERARRALEAARADLRTRSEQSGLVEADPSAGFDDRAVREAEVAFAAVEARVRESRQPHIQAESALGQARSLLEGMERERAAIQTEEANRIRLVAEAQAATRQAERELQSSLEGMDAVLAPYLRANRRLMRLSELPRQSEALLRQIGGLRREVGDELASEMEAALRDSERLQAQLLSEQAELREDGETAARESTRLFRAHAREVLGEGLLEVVAEA